MTSTGTLLRMFGAAILLIVVQFASVAAEAHIVHGHGSDGISLQGHSHQAYSHQAHRAAAEATRSISFDKNAAANRAARAQPAAQAETAVQNARDAALGADSCVMGCCGTGMGCCGAALAVVSPNLPAEASSLRIGFAHVVSIQEVDPRGLRKPPRSLV